MRTQTDSRVSLRRSAQQYHHKMAETTRRSKSSVQSSTSYTTVPLPPCRVCGGTATGFHFGVITCESCKAFFRRALIHKQRYQCIENDDCQIKDKRLGNCSACRLQKCFDVGMSKEGVRRGRYSIAIRTKAIIEAKQRRGGKDAAITRTISESQSSVSSKSCMGISSSSPGSPSPSPTPLIAFTELSSLAAGGTTMATQDIQPSPPTVPENRELDQLVDALVSSHEVVYPNTKMMFDTQRLQQHHRKIYEQHHIKQEVFGLVEPLSTEHYQEIFGETGIDLDDRLAHFDAKGRIMEIEIMQFINYAKVIPGFKNVDPQDVATLLKSAHFEFWIFGHYNFMNHELGVVGGDCTSHVAHKNDMSKFFPKDNIDKMLAFAESLKPLNLTLEELCILRAIILTFTDRCRLLEPEKIEHLQIKFLNCLIYHIRKNNKRPYKKLASIFDRLTAVRELTIENAQVNRKFLHEWEFLMHEYPLWKEMLSYDEV